MKAWSQRHLDWIRREVKFDLFAQQATLEDYLAVRSAMMRLLDPAAMGRFRVMGFGRGWPAGPPLAGFAYRLGRR
jgi:hypothetical protein